MCQKKVVGDLLAVLQRTVRANMTDPPSPYKSGSGSGSRLGSVSGSGLG